MNQSVSVKNLSVKCLDDLISLQLEFKLLNSTDKMSFIQKTIKETITEIHEKKILLPSIQREFVWSPYQIEMLFDSILRGYPISSFLFWHIKKENLNKFTLYEFLKDYHERDHRHNPKVNLALTHGDVTGILDGQQRLASFYFALMGSYAARIKGGWWDKDSSFPPKYLYLNLRQEADDLDMEYDFRFLTKEQAAHTDENTYWFKVGDILSMKEVEEVMYFVIDKKLNDTALPTRILSRLFKAVHSDTIINFYLEKSEELDKVLNIFIRINSGGTKLSYSDMLLSIATGQWEKKDAREEIHKLVDEIQRKDFWGISKDWVLKACLYLSDINDIKFKVDNFSKENMLKIEQEWDGIVSSLHKAVDLISGFGYASSKGNIATYNAILPIAYYLHRFQHEPNFLTSSKFLDKRKEIHKWFMHVSIKQMFSSQVDSTLTQFRKSIKESSDFSYENLKESIKSLGKALTFYEEDIDSILDSGYSNKNTYSILCLLYPSLDYKNHFHIDHIHPRYEVGYHYLSDSLPNLQLLEGTLNQEKSASPFLTWLEANYKTEDSRKDYLRRNFIPESPNPDFEKFYEERKNILRDQLKKVLQLN